MQFVIVMKLHNFFFLSTVFFTPIDSSYYSVHKVLRYNYQKMNSLRDILHFISKCVNFLSTHLKEYLIKRNFIIVFCRALKISYKNICNKNGGFCLKNSSCPCPDLGNALKIKLTSVNRSF